MQKGTLEEQLRDEVVRLQARVAELEARQDERKRAEDERKEIEQSLRESREQLARLNRAKTTFFSNISHEFRTPLTLLLRPLEDMLNDASVHKALPPSVLKQLSLAYHNALHLLKLVNTLLDFSRLEAGRMQVVYVPTDLALLTRDLASMFSSVAEQAGLQLLVACSPLSEPIYVDRDMWEKIVLNLLSNAFKFTFEGQIQVSLHQIGDQVRLEVCDTGTGIPAEELPHLFEHFHRVQRVRTRTHGGSGIGLALVQDLVRLHGGTISATSVPEQGSTFTVTIPTGTAHLSAGQVQSTRSVQETPSERTLYLDEVLRWFPMSSSHSQNGVQNGHSKSSLTRPSKHEGAHPYILLAEDNADMRDYLVSLLSDAGYSVEAVGNGRAALNALSKRVPNLLLSDVMMPELDGIQLLKQVRVSTATQRLPVILLSARAGERAAIEGLETGTDDYLIKPFSARELLARVRTNIELGRMREEAVQRAQQHNVRLQGLYEALLAVNSTLSLETVLELIGTQASELIGAEYALTSFTADQEWAQFFVSTSASTKDDAQAEHLHERAASVTSKSHNSHNLKEQLEPLRQHYAHFLSKPITLSNWLEAPLLQRNGNEIGLVQLANKTEGVFTEEDQLVFLQLAQMTSLALENAQSYKLAQDTIQTQRERENFTSLLTAFLLQELHNPLSAFATYLQTTSSALKRELETQPQFQQQRVQDINISLEYVQQLLTQLRDLSLTQSGQLELDYTENVNLVQLARDVVAGQRANNVQHIFTVIPDEEPLIAECDRVRVEQVLTCLVKHITTSSSTDTLITVSLKQNSVQDEILVSVQNEAASRAKDSAYQFDLLPWVRKLQEDDKMELALGLYLSDAFVKLHGGKLWFKSTTTGQACSFHFSLLKKQRI